MSDLEYLRNLIDQQDRLIMEALEKRFEIVRKIGQVKKQQHINVTHEGREQEILQRCETYTASKHLKPVYQTIFNESKILQTERYGLVGQNISHSLSPRLHEEMAHLDYQIFEPDNFAYFIRSKAYEGLNITIPFKEQAFDLVDEPDATARKTKVVNTIVNDHGILKGFNTDYNAFDRLLKTFKVDIRGKKVLIIGNGATSRTVRSIIEGKSPQAVTNVVRTIRNENEVLIGEYRKFIDYEVIINTTPYGSVPNLESQPLFRLNEFSHLEAAIDVIYQPLNSPFLQDARHVCPKVINGLYMLIAQAHEADERFLDRKFDPAIIDEVYRKYRYALPNIVLIGMPYSGKTTIGALVAKMTDREFLDTDELLAKEGHDINTVLQNGGTVEEFRQYETILIDKLSISQNKVIATGGGAVINPQNVMRLKANGVLAWVNPAPDKLKERNNGTRPLAKNNKDLEELYLERLSFYFSAKDIISNNDGEPEAEAKKLLEKFYEYLDYQWPQP